MDVIIIDSKDPEEIVDSISQGILYDFDGNLLLDVICILSKRYELLTGKTLKYFINSRGNFYVFRQ